MSGVTLGYGIMLDSIADQLAAQGYMVHDAHKYEKYRHAILVLSFAGLLTASQEKMAFEKLHKKIMQNVRPLEP